jgi:hypothetical protein
MVVIVDVNDEAQGIFGGAALEIIDIIGLGQSVECVPEFLTQNRGKTPLRTSSMA